MEQVFPISVEAVPLGRSFLSLGDRSLTASYKTGVIDRVLGDGHFIVSLGVDSKVEARGLKSLRAGDQVRVLFKAQSPAAGRENAVSSATSTQEGEGVLKWSAFFPLGFGGKHGSAKLEVYSDSRRKTSLKKDTQAVYFLFSIVTEGQGEMQWGVHLKEKQVSIQVYFQKYFKNAPEIFMNLTAVIESSLKKQGFRMIAPTVLLVRPIRVPEGYRLNLRG